MLGISRSPLTEPGYNSISLFFFNYFFALPWSLTEVPCLSLSQTQTWGSFIAGWSLCWSFLLLLPALPGNAAASRGPHSSTASPEFLTLELGGGKCSETVLVFFMSISPGTLHNTVVKEI